MSAVLLQFDICKNQLRRLVTYSNQLCCAEAVSKPKVTPLMQFLHDKHSLKPEKKTIVVPVKKVMAAQHATAFAACKHTPQQQLATCSCAVEHVQSMSLCCTMYQGVTP